MGKQIAVITAIIVFLVLGSALLFTQKDSQNSNTNPSQNIILPRGVITPQELWTKRNELENTEVIVQGNLNISWSCTDAACSPEYPDCNSCFGVVSFEIDKQNGIFIPIRANDDLNRYSCTDPANSNNISCHSLEPGKTYRLTGTFKKDEAYHYSPNKEYYTFALYITHYTEV